MTKREDLENKHFSEAKSWDDDRVDHLHKSERRAWWVARLAAVIALLSVGAVVGLAPLKTVVPLVLRVDNNTGIVDVVSGLKAGKDAEYDEVVDKYFLAKYIRHREHYLPETRNHDRHVVGLMSSDGIRQQYAAFTDPRKNSGAPTNVYGDTAEVVVKIKNISPIKPGVAQVRYIKTVKRAGQTSKPTHWVATIAFKYTNAKMKPEDRLISPLGFLATQYRNDPETIQ